MVCLFFSSYFFSISLPFANQNNRYKDANPVDPSSTVGIFNDGTELRISTIRHEDIGDYTCIARNGEGQVSHTARVIIAGGAVIMVKETITSDLQPPLFFYNNIKSNKKSKLNLKKNYEPYTHPDTNKYTLISQLAIQSY